MGDAKRDSNLVATLLGVSMSMALLRNIVC